MSEPDFAELERLARAASGVAWKRWSTSGDEPVTTWLLTEPDAAYIAAASPDVVLRLLARRAPGDRADRIEAAANRVMKLLEPLDRQAADGGGSRHMVEVTAETWRYNATPMIDELRAALAADSRPEQSALQAEGDL